MEGFNGSTFRIEAQLQVYRVLVQLTKDRVDALHAWVYCLEVTANAPLVCKFRGFFTLGVQAGEELWIVRVPLYNFCALRELSLQIIQGQLLFRHAR